MAFCRHHYVPLHLSPIDDGLALLIFILKTKALRSDILLVVFYGAVLGNVVGGVPLDEEGVFFEPRWTDFRVGAVTGILD